MSVVRSPAQIVADCRAAGLTPPPWVAEAQALIAALENPARLQIGLEIDLADDDAADRRETVNYGW